MSHWLDRVAEVLEAETSDLRELAKMAGASPQYFYVGSSLSREDIVGQDVRGLEFDFPIDSPQPRLREQTQYRTPSSRSQQRKLGRTFETDMSVANALFARGKLGLGRDSRTNLNSALKAYRSAIAHLDVERHSAIFAQVLSDIGSTLVTLSRVSADDAEKCRLLVEATKSYEQALVLRRSANAEFEVGITLNSLGTTEYLLCLSSRGESRRRSLEKSIEYFSMALEVFKKESIGFYVKLVKQNIEALRGLS